MRRLLLAAICLVPLAAHAQSSDRGTAPAPAPVPAVPPPSAQTGGANVPPEVVAPADKGAVGGVPDHATRSQTGGGAAN